MYCRGIVISLVERDCRRWVYWRSKGVPPALGLWLETALDSGLVLGGLLGLESPVEDDDSLSCDEDGDDGQSDRNENKTTTKLI